MRTFLLLIFLSAFAQLSALDASLSYARFATPTGKAYLEIHSHLAGSTLNWIPISEGDSLLRARVDFTILIRSGEDILVADRFIMSGPASIQPEDFIDLQRYALDPGKYQMDISIVDVADSTNLRKYHTEVELPAWPEKIGQSDIVMLANLGSEVEEGHPFARHGLLMEPLPYNFYGRGANTLALYHEVYATDRLEGEKVLLLTKIEELRNGKANPVRAVNKVYEKGPLLPLAHRIDISSLPTGNYLLAVEVRSEQNELISRRELMFQRSNPLVDQQLREEMLATVDFSQEFVGDLGYDSLRYSCLALLPLMPQGDIIAINDMIKRKDDEALRIYLFAYWSERSPYDPAAGYYEYMRVARGVDKTFNSGFRNGFETDRGYIYLKYGQPNDMTRVETDPTAPPYEIWSYDVIERTNQHNRRFIFYNPSLAGEDFILLHSDVFGEVNNPQWELILMSNAPGEQPQDYLNGTNMPDKLGRQARRILSDY